MRNSSMMQSQTRRLVSILPLAVILLSGAALRFYNLGARAPWWDEILVPMVSHHSLSYIFDFSSLQEVHPPLFYLLIKAVLLVSSSGSALRLISAFSGVASIFILYRIVRIFFDKGTALLAATFLSINMLHILLSREIRPYALQTALFLASVWFIVRLTKEGRWRDLFFLCCSNFLLFWLHYFAFYMVAAQGIILLFFLFCKPCFFTWRQFVVFCIFTVLTTVPIYVWFVLPNRVLVRGVTGHYSWLVVVRSIFDDLRIASSFALLGHFGDSLMYLVPLTGCAAFLFRRPKFAALCLLFWATPLVIVLAMTPGYPLQWWQLTWMTPFLSLLAAMALSWLPGCKVTAPLLAACGALFIVVHHHGVYYEPASGKANIQPPPLTSPLETGEIDFRETAAQLRPLFSPGALITDAESPGFFNAISWQFDRLPQNPLAMQRLEPGAAPITLHFLAGRAYPGEEDTSDAYLRLVMHGMPKSVRVRDAMVHTFQVDRKPVTAIDKLPFDIAFSAYPEDFYSHVFRLQNVRSIHMNVGLPLCPEPPPSNVLYKGVIATRNNQPAFFEFVLENNAGDKPMHFSVNFQYRNGGVGNQIGLFVRFDNEPPVLVAQSAGLDCNRSPRIDFSREKPFKRLAFIVRMYCTDKTALYFGDNLKTLVFEELQIKISEVGAVVPPGPPVGGTIPKNGN